MKGLKAVSHYILNTSHVGWDSDRYAGKNKNRDCAFIQNLKTSNEKLKGELQVCNARNLGRETAFQNASFFQCILWHCEELQPNIQLLFCFMLLLTK
jgi:hypothetical protein